MLTFRAYSIRQKLISMSLLASSVALALAATAFMTYDFLTYRASLVKSVSTLAEIIGFNAASAVVFNDSASATKTLATLKLRSNIVSAGIYSPTGHLFAEWHREAGGVGPAASMHFLNRESHHFRAGALDFFQPMILDRSPIGMVYVQSDLGDLTARLKRYASIAAGVLLISLLVAGSISFQVAQKISAPILHLADVAKAITEKKDYSVRAAGGGLDEVGRLVQTFNAMLTKIQQDGEAIQKAQTELEQRVEERTSQLSVANKELEAFSYSVSHDLRAPLRHISGFTDLLLKSAVVQGNATAARYSKIVADSVRHMGALIDDLLSFSRMGRTELLKTKLNLDEVVKDVLEDLKSQTDNRQVEWKIGSLPGVHGDPSMIRLVLVNLLSNALKYSRQRGKAVIEVGTSMDTKGERFFFVRDNGAGFDMKYANKLFGVFQRLHSPEEFEGTGIGLATVRRIIQRHGGRTWAEGVVGQGAVFYFTLP